MTSQIEDILQAALLSYLPDEYTTWTAHKNRRELLPDNTKNYKSHLSGYVGEFIGSFPTQDIFNELSPLPEDRDFVETSEAKIDIISLPFPITTDMYLSCGDGKIYVPRVNIYKTLIGRNILLRIKEYVDPGAI